MNRITKHIIGAAASVAVILGMSACAGITPQQALTTAEQIAAAVAPSAIQAYEDYTAAGGSINASQDIPLALQSGSKVAGVLYTTTASTSGSSAALAQTQTLLSGLAVSYSNQPQAAKVAKSLVAAALAQLPANPSAAQVTTAIVGAGIAASSAAPSQPAAAPASASSGHEKAGGWLVTVNTPHGPALAFSPEFFAMREEGFEQPRVEIDPR